MTTKNLWRSAFVAAVILVIGSAAMFFQLPSPVSQEAVEQTHNATATQNSEEKSTKRELIPAKLSLVIK